MLLIPSTSKQYLSVPVSGAGLTGVEPVSIAIIAPTVEEPATGDWKTAVWDSGNAKILIGPGTSLALPNGIYRVWVKITAGSEVPVVRSGLLRIT